MISFENRIMTTVPKQDMLKFTVSLVLYLCICSQETLILHCPRLATKTMLSLATWGYGALEG